MIGGEERWRRRIKGLENELKLQLTELEEEDEARAAAITANIGRLGGFRRLCAPTDRRACTAPEIRKLGRWLDQLEALATRALRNPERVLSILSELAPMSFRGASRNRRGPARPF